jgi:hypothetical protein
VARHAGERPFRVDYLAYDTAATIIGRGDAERLFDPELQHEVQEERSGNNEPSYLVYLNPPAVGAAFVPFTFLPARAGYVAAVCALTAIHFAAAALLYRLLDGMPSAAGWLLIIGIAGSTATASALISGQLTPVLLLMGAGALTAYRAGRPAVAGAVLGLLFIKPHFALAAFVALLIARQRKVAAYMLLGVAAGAVASLAIIGPGGAEGYVDIMRRSFSRPASLYIDVRSEQNASGLIALLFHVYGGWTLTAANAAVTLIALGAVYRAMARSPYNSWTHTQYVAALIAVFVATTAAHIQFYDLAILAFPAMFVVQRASVGPREGRSRFYGVIVLTVLWVEAAGMLAGARLSVSIVPLMAFTLMMCQWPRVERWLLSGAAPGAARPTAREGQLAA